MYCFVWTVSYIVITFLDNFTDFDELEKEMPSLEYNTANHVIRVIIRGYQWVKQWLFQGLVIW
jgi:hypothetical protein